MTRKRRREYVLTFLLIVGIFISAGGVGQFKDWLALQPTPRSEFSFIDGMKLFFGLRDTRDCSPR